MRFFSLINMEKVELIQLSEDILVKLVYLILYWVSLSCKLGSVRIDFVDIIITFDLEKSRARDISKGSGLKEQT